MARGASLDSAREGLHAASQHLQQQQPHDMQSVVEEGPGGARRRGGAAREGEQEGEEEEEEEEDGEECEELGPSHHPRRYSHGKGALSHVASRVRGVWRRVMALGTSVA